MTGTPADTSDTALLFPGQGVDVASIGAGVEAALPELVSEARTQLGDDPFSRSTDGTNFAQPAVYLASLAGFRRLEAPAGAAMAGHSMGEITALVAAGAVEPADGLRAVIARGRLMEEAAASAEPGGMLAVGGSRDQAASLASEFSLALANENSSTQYVLSGPLAHIEDAERKAKEIGVRAKRLTVAGAFHSKAMQPAVAPFREVLDSIEFHETEHAVVSGASEKEMPESKMAADRREMLAQALITPVRWIDVLHRLHAGGARRFVDVGPGKVLAGLAKKTLDGITTETNELEVPEHV